MKTNRKNPMSVAASDLAQARLVARFAAIRDRYACDEDAVQALLEEVQQ